MNDCILGKPMLHNVTNIIIRDINSVCCFIQKLSAVQEKLGLEAPKNT